MLLLNLMIQIEIHAVPYGIEQRRIVLYTMDIVNDESGDGIRDNYDITLFKRGTKVKTGKVRNHPRTDADLISLVSAALNSVDVDKQE